MKKEYVGMIRELISSTGLSIFELAIEIEASPQSIYRWMEGITRPNCEHLVALWNLIKIKSDIESKDA